jgi:hypothetical protein
MSSFDHVERIEAARGFRPGWRVVVPPASARPDRPARRCTFYDTDHGSPGAALDAALRWRDEEKKALAPRDPHVKHRVRSDAEGALVPGIFVTKKETGGTVYPLIRASVHTPGGRQRTLTRSVGRRSTEDALREVVDFRFREMKAVHGDDFPYRSAEELYRDAHEALQSNPVAEELGLTTA